MDAITKLHDVSSIDTFNGAFFKRWQEQVFSTLDVLNLSTYLTKLKPTKGIDNYNKALVQWEKGSKICSHTILSTLSNELFDIYCSYKTTKEIWDNLNKKYVIEDDGTQKYAIGNFLQFQMVESEDVSLQIHEYPKLVNELKNEDVDLPETFVCGSLIENFLNHERTTRTT